jgi:hypothetical protein
VVRLERGHHGLAQTILAFRLKTILCEVELFSILYVYPYKKLPPPLHPGDLATVAPHPVEIITCSTRLLGLFFLSQH